MNTLDEHEPVTGLAREDGTLDGGAILRLLNRPLSPEDLREATERFARPLAQVEENLVSLLVFRTADELLALPVTAVAQVTPAAAVHWIPHRSNKIIRGLSNIDGELLICASLEDLLELAPSDAPGPRDADNARRMIVLGPESDRWTVQVDEVIGVARVDPDAHKQPPLTVECSLRRYTESLVPLDQSIASLLSVERVLAGFQAALS
jgi:chemotaxis signal transduction protein